MTRPARLNELTGVNFIGWYASGKNHLLGMTEGQDALARATAAAAFLQAQGFTTSVTSTQFTDGTLSHVTIDAERP